MMISQERRMYEADETMMMNCMQRNMRGITNLAAATVSARRLGAVTVSIIESVALHRGNT